MIGLRRNKRGDMVLTIDSYIDIDSTPDINPTTSIVFTSIRRVSVRSMLYCLEPVQSYRGNVATNRYSSIRRYRERDRSSTISSMPM